MKRFIILLVAFAGLQAAAQIPDDALIISRYNYDGSARSQAMGGAFTALGSDLTNASLNPAGLGLYRSSEFGISMTGNMSKTDAMYLGENSTTHHYSTILPNFGIAMSTPNINQMSNGEGPDSWTFAVGYNQIHTFNKSISLEGTNATSSYLDMVLDNPNMYPAFTETEVVYIPEGSNLYTHDYLNEGYGTFQEGYISERGGIGEYYVSGAANFSDKFYIGGTLGIQSLHLERTLEFSETPTNYIALHYFDMTQTLTTSGLGINAKLGILYSPEYWVKIGLSIHTPTSFNLTDDFSESLDTKITDGGTFTSSYADNPYFPDYNILTPMRINSGVSFMIMRRALLAIDYEYVDYGMAQISSEDYSFNQENADIADLYTVAHSVRVGGEYKLGRLAFRAGGYYYGSPYDKVTTNEDAYILGYSGGIGIRSGSYSFDVSWSQSTEDFHYSPYTYEMAEVTNKNTRITGSLGFRF